MSHPKLDTTDSLSLRAMTRPRAAARLLLAAPSLLLLLFFVLHTPLAHAYPSHRIALPNGEYIETNEDLKVKVMGGYIIAKREWTNSRWYLTPEWADLKFTYDDLDNSVKAIDRAGAIYERSGEAWFLETKYRIQKTAVGYRWSDNQGAWATYGDEGKITAVGDRNLTRAVFTYDAGGRRSEVKDAHGNLALKFTYDAAGLLQTVEDRAGRQVHYHYSGDRLTRVTDVLGNEWKYTYDSHGQIQTRTDPEGNAIQLFYVDPNPAGKAEGGGFSASAKTKAQSAAYGYTGKPLRDVKTARVGTYTDAEGNVTTYQYQYNRQTRKYTVTQISPLGTRTTTIYDKNGRVLQNTIGSLTTRSVIRESDKVEAIIDARGLITRVSYDGNRNILKTVYPDGSSVHNTYDPYDQLLTRTDELGIITRYEYDAKGNLTRLTEAAGLPEQRITEYEYDQYGQRTQTILRGDSEADDIVTQWKYDNYGNVAEFTDAEGNTTKFTYDVMGKITRITDPRDAITEYENDLAGNLVKQTEAKGTAEEIKKIAIYDKAGNRIKYIDSKENVTLYVYDKSGRQIEMIDPEGGISTITYDKNGRAVKKTDADMVEQFLEYDQLGNLTTVKDMKNNIVQFVYGEIGSGLEDLLVKTIFPTYSEEYKYDNRGRKIQVRRKISEETETIMTSGYDARGNLVEEIDALGRITKISYDHLKRKKEVIDPLSGSAKFEYDKANNLLKFIDPKGTVTQYQYDKIGRKIQETYSSGSSVFYAYDNAGNLAEIKNASGKKQVYTHNALNQLVKEEHFPSGQNNPVRAISYFYDANGSLTKYEDKGDNGNIVGATYSYDGNNRKTSQTVNYGAFQKTHQFSYTAAGRRSQRIDPDNVTETILWDEIGRVKEIKWGDSSLSVGDYEWRVPRLMNWPNGVKQEYTYDSLQRVTTIKLTKAEEMLMKKEYLYDRAGNIISITDDDESKTYGYDALDRLVTVSRSKGNNENYVYDAVGNRLKDHAQNIYTYNTKHQLEKIESKGNESVKTFFYDEDGHAIKETEEETIREFLYGANGRLSEIKQDEVAVATYKYDPFVRRVKKEIAGVVTWFSYDDTGLIAEYTDSGEQIVAYGYWPDQTWQTNPVYKRTGTDGSAYHYFHNDHLGTPQRLTNNEGKISWAGQYEAFGKVKETTSNTANPFRFPGQYQDNETGFYQNYYRDYAPMLGRYIQSDPIGLDGGINRYTYVSANPLKNVDPQGLIEWQGSGGSASFFGGGVDFYNLTSECACNKQVNARVMAVYTTASANPYAVISGTGGSSCFKDTSSCPDKSNLAGSYMKAYVGGAIILGGYYGFIQLGKAISCNYRVVWNYGFDIGIATFAVGGSFVLKSSEWCCDIGNTDIDNSRIG